MSDGNVRQLWLAAPGGSPVYAKITPQRDMSRSDSRSTQDAGHKNSGGLNLARSGNRTISISLDFVAEWPDAAAETAYAAYKAGTPLLVQQRDGPTDVVFACEMLLTSFAVTDPFNGVSTGSLSLSPSAIPTIDLLVAP
ncbi:hypothetical protein GCM10007973_18430 [Polymorphobacter multimanifer]|uniref:Phage tail protein n=1 Tax=Polymorphobacter multimanifer TaxID=1070431 RepID=A0A841LHB8_9SPHN|nr:phage tail tube protein [Polymorphobacter multimanifer]MBB6228358.1 hypothetical protein [Polymorphobacter multimanifer]GGI82280.1 hypothetical protein GCM10007973_18430 [Polymorphobacter multimanifer]